MPSDQHTYNSAIPLTEKIPLRSSLLVFASAFPEQSPGRRPLSTTVQVPINEVYEILTEVENLPLFLENLEKVEGSENKLAASKVQWHFKNKSKMQSDLSIFMNLKTQNQSGLTYKTEDGAGFNYTIAIELAPAQANRGTIVRMMTTYENAQGDLAGKIEKLFGTDAELLTKKNLQRFKAFCETGQVPTTEGQPNGRDEDEAQAHNQDHLPGPNPYQNLKH